MISKLSIFEDTDLFKVVPSDIIDEIKATYLNQYLRIPTPNKYFDSDMVEIWKDRIDGYSKEEQKYNLTRIEDELYEPTLRKYKGNKIMYEARDFYIVYSPDDIEDKKLYDKFNKYILPLVEHTYNDRLGSNKIMNRDMIFALVYMYINIKHNISKLRIERSLKDTIELEGVDEDDGVINGVAVIDGVNYDVVDFNGYSYITDNPIYNMNEILISGYSDNIRNFIHGGSWGEDINETVTNIAEEIMKEMGVIYTENYF